MKLFRVIVPLAVLLFWQSGCAFFNTYFNARKAFNNGVNNLHKKKEQLQSQSRTLDEITIHRFEAEPETITDDTRQFFDIAIEKANKVVALHPDSRWVENAILLMGKAYYYRGTQNDFYDAKNRFEVYIAQYAQVKDVSEAKLWYGKTLIKLQLFDEAQKVLSEITTSPDRRDEQNEAFILLGDIAFANNQLDEAVKYYVHAAEIAHREATVKDAFFKAGFTFYQLGNYDKALDYFRALNRMSLDVPEKFDLTLMMARALKGQGQYDQAIAQLDKIISNLRYKNFFIRAEFEIADILRMKGRYTEASEQFQYVIDTYKNALYTGNAYYYLALMNDAPPVKRDDGFTPNPTLAKKYYYLIQTKYPQTLNKEAAVARFQYLTKMETFKGFISADENLYKKLLLKISNPSIDITRLQETTAADTAENETDDAIQKTVKTYRAVNTANLTENFFKTDTVTAADSLLALRDSLLQKDSTLDWLSALELDSASLKELLQQDSLLKAQESIEKRTETSQPTAKKEVEDVKLENKELQEKLEAVKKELAIINTEPDSLLDKKRALFDRLAEDYIMLADYFYNDLANYDSALFYYQWAGEKYRGSASQELVLYSIARVHQKLKNPNWKIFYESAYREFPDGRLADIARQVLNLNGQSDLFYDTFREAEKSFVEEKNFEKAASLYKTIAQSDTSRLKWASLYALGLLYEQKLDDADRAFRTYATLIYARPASEFARKVRPKVDAYMAKFSLPKDSVFKWVDTLFVKISVQTSMTADSLTADPTITAPIDSASIRAADSTIVKDTLNKRFLKDEEGDLLFDKNKRKKDKKQRDEIQNDKIKKEDDDIEE